MLVRSMRDDLIVIVMAAENVEHAMLGMVDMMVSGEQVVELGSIVIDSFKMTLEPLLSGRFGAVLGDVPISKVLESFYGSPTARACCMVGVPLE